MQYISTNVLVHKLMSFLLPSCKIKNKLIIINSNSSKLTQKQSNLFIKFDGRKNITHSHQINEKNSLSEESLHGYLSQVSLLLPM